MYSEDEICILLPVQASSAPGGNSAGSAPAGKISALHQGPAVLRDSVGGKRRPGQVTKCSSGQGSWFWLQLLRAGEEVEFGTWFGPPPNCPKLAGEEGPGSFVV